MILLIAFLSLSNPAASIAQLPPQLEGDWIGGFMYRGEWVTVVAHLASEPNGIGGTADVAFTDYEGERGVPLNAIDTERSAVSFTVPMNRGTIGFDGRVADGTISGEYRLAGTSGTFGLVRTVPVSRGKRAGLFGAYEIAPGHIVSIFDYAGSNLRLIDYPSGQQNTLYPVSSEMYVSGPGQTMAYPVAHTIRFVPDGQGRVKELRWRAQGRRERVARRVPFEEVPLTCAHDTVTLAGTLILPKTPGPHAAIIITPGDFGSSRDGLRGYAYNFVRRGIAALVFDSRGAGGSTGVVGSSSFRELADDVLAWVALLRQRGDIRPTKIGLFGFSNSSWTVTLAASRSRDVAFLISQSTSALPPWRQERFRAERQIRLAGFPEGAVRSAVELMDLKFEVARTGEGWAELQSALEEEHANERWLPYTNPPRSLERLRAYWDRSFSYDPMPALRNLICPTLFVFGGVDSNMPVDASLPLIRKALAGAGNKDYTIRVFPRGRHDLIEGRDGGPREFPRMKRFVPGYWDAMADWVSARVRSAPRD